MARTVDEVNASIKDATGIIAKQGALVGLYQSQIEANSKEYDALKKQKDTLEKTYSELEELYKALSGNCDSLGETYGSTNGFAKGFSAAAHQKIEDSRTKTLQKILDMVDKIDIQMQKCSNDLEAAQINLGNARQDIENAQNSLASLNQELQQAEEEAALEAAAGV